MTRKRKFMIGQECRQILEKAFEKQVPVSVTAHNNSRWQMHKSRFLAIRSNRLILSQPIPEPGGHPMELTDGQQLAVSFKKGYYKCLFVSRVVGRSEFELEDGQSVPTIEVLRPEEIEKIQRRAYNRADAPQDQPVQVTIRPRSSEQRQGRTSQYGTLLNLSAGGVAIIMGPGPDGAFQEQQQYELQFVPLPHQEPLILQGRLRHVTQIPENGQYMLGFQLVGLEMDETGRSVLRKIGRVVSVYQRQKQNARFVQGR